MNIVTVYPIIRGAFKDELTYWSAADLTPGTVISVPLRGRTIPALVGQVVPARHAKANIKQASFVTRKIEKVIERKAVSKASVRACHDTATYFNVPFSKVLKACISDVALSYEEPINESGDAADTSEKAGSSDKKKKGSTSSPKESTASMPLKSQLSKVARGIFRDTKDEDEADIGTVDAAPGDEFLPEASHEKDANEDIDTNSEKNPPVSPDVLVYQTNSTDRMGTLKSIVREEFARKKSALIVVPTVMAAEETAELLRKGIEDYVVILHGSLAKKKQETAWKTAITETHPLLIITTPYFASVPRKDLSTVILERESSRAYHSPVEPFIDYRFYIEELARHSGCRLILSDSLLRAETLYRRENGSVQDFFPLSYRIEKGAELIVTDTSKKKDKFEAMSEELQSMIEHAGKKSERMFIFSSRRGLAPQTVCEDCGLTVTCDNCSAPLVLHKSRNEHDRYFLCHHCGSQQDATEAACKRCGSWKLKMLGIASDTIAEEIRKQFPDRRLFILDRDAVKTDKQAKTLVKEFLETKTGILLGTESALAFLPEVAYSAIASLDSLFSLPDFRINERICRIILRLLEKTTWYTLIQTRDGDNGVLKHIASGSLMAFCKEELEMREALNYPPYSTHIKATVEGTKEEAAERMKKLQDLLADNAESVESMIFPAFIPTQKGKSVLHMLLTVPSDEWPNAHNIHKLRALLASLPKDYSVRVEPDSLL